MNPELLSSDFVPRRFVRGAHAQTILATFAPRHAKLPPHVSMEVDVEPGTRVRVDCHWQPRRETAFTALLLHGLEGSSQSPFMLGMARFGLDRGMNVVRMNMRNCGGTEHLTNTLYHSGLSGDVRAVVDKLVGDMGIQRLGLVGYSMGGNMVLKAAGEWGASPPSALRCVATVCPAMDLSASSDALHLPHNRTYEWFFLAGLLRRFHQKARLFPTLFNAQDLSLPRSLREFDDVVTARHSGFSGVEDYYTRASSAPVAPAIHVPTLVLHAQDDPFVVLTPPTRAALGGNPNIRLVEPTHGGHCGFWSEGAAPGSFWAERRVMDFLSQHA